MSAGKIRGKILVELWLAEKPITLQALSEKIEISSSSTMGYLLGLIKAKYVYVAQKHYYAISNVGKKAIGLPIVDKELAQKILQSVSIEKSFHFYNDMDDYSGLYSDGLIEFVEKIMIVDSKSLLFHISRKDFENWIRYLGDIELSKKIGIIRTIKLDGEDLRKKLYQTIKKRIEKLTKFFE